MKNRNQLFSVCFVCVLFIFAAFMAWYIPSMSSVLAKTEETRSNLSTSRGRENRQQDEYDKAAAELPLILDQAAEKKPLAEEAEKQVNELKLRRKALRAEKQALEEKLAEAEPAQEGSDNE